MKRLLLALTAASLMIPTVSVAAKPIDSAATSAFLDGPRHRTYDRQGRYQQPRRIGRNDRVWRGNDGQYHCRRSNGTTGLIIGAAGGALIGREIDSRGERATGTILGAAAGALLGREIERGNARCR